MPEYIVSIFLIIWEILCCKLLLESFAYKRKYRYKATQFGLFVVLLSIYYLITYIFYNFLWLKQIAIVGVMSVAMYLYFAERYLKIVVLTMIYQGLMLIADYTALLVIGAVFPSINKALKLSYSVAMLVSIICKVVLLCVILILKRKIGHKHGDMLTDMEWLRLLLVPVFTIASLITIVLKYNVLQNITQDNVLIYIALGMAAINILVFYLIGDIMEREAIIRKNRIFLEKVRNETDMYYSISENLDKQRKRTHEFKNQIACISSLAGSRNYEKLIEYIREIDDGLKLSMDMVDTNNVIVNAILNTKYREALNRQIVFVLKVNDLSNLSLPDSDIVGILSNLINNAIEACIACENKVIKLKFVLEDDQIIISVKNTMASVPIKENEKFITEKIDEPEEHGIGVQNVIEIIEKHGGKYVIEYDETVFSFSILIPNPHS